MARACSDCGKKFDVFWWGDEKLCRACFVRNREDNFVQTEVAATTTIRPTKLRSFAAANGLFDLLSVAAWLIIAIGVIAALVLLSQIPGSLGALVSVMSGISSVVLGLFILALVQIGRATVYSAETSGEMLVLARKAELRAGEEAS